MKPYRDPEMEREEGHWSSVSEMASAAGEAGESGGAAEMGCLLCVPSTHPALNGGHLTWFCGLTGCCHCIFEPQCPDCPTRVQEKTVSPLLVPAHETCLAGEEV